MPNKKLALTEEERRLRQREHIRKYLSNPDNVEKVRARARAYYHDNREHVAVRVCMKKYKDRPQERMEYIRRMIKRYQAELAQWERRMKKEG